MVKQEWIFAAVALIMILAVGVKAPKAAAVLLGLILLAAAIFRWEQIRAVIYGG